MISKWPTNAQFQQSQKTLVSILKTQYKDLSTGKASVIRELIIRPFAFLYSKVNQIISTWLHRTSIQYLQKSLDTSDSIADVVASNYFVKRKPGKNASGTVLVYSISPTLRFSSGTRVQIDGHQFIVPTTCIASTQYIQSNDDLQYLQMYRINNKYVTNLPVVAAQQVYIQIPSGVQCNFKTYVANLQRAQVLSSITGGSQAQTNKSMFQRARIRCGTAIGTADSLKLRLQQAPVQVLSCHTLLGSQYSCFRSRYNNLDLPYGGVVDTYIKTANQLKLSQIRIRLKKGISQFYIQTGNDSQLSESNVFIDNRIAGCIKIDRLQLADAAQRYSSKFKYQFISKQPTIVSDIGARCSIYQKVKISIPDQELKTLPDSQQIDVIIWFSYMQYIDIIQDFLSKNQQGFLGLDCYIKAAIPINVIVHGFLVAQQVLTQQQLNEVKSNISKLINSLQVGQSILNMDLINQQLKALYNNSVSLRLPYNIEVIVPLVDGTIYNFQTSNGVIQTKDIQNSKMWDTKSYFFSCTPNNILLQVL